MSHGHHGGHTHAALTADPFTAAMDLSIADSDLSPSELTRRNLLRNAGLLGAGAAAAGGIGWYLLREEREPTVTRNERIFTDER